MTHTILQYVFYLAILVILAIPFGGYIGKQLISKGITVEYIDFEISRSLGGSFRCSTQPLLRY